MLGCTRGEDEDAGGVWRTKDDHETMDQALVEMDQLLDDHRIEEAQMAQSQIPESPTNGIGNPYAEHAGQHQVVQGFSRNQDLIPGPEESEPKEADMYMTALIMQK